MYLQNQTRTLIILHNRNLLTGICGDCNSDPGNDLTDPQDVTDNYLVYDPDATNEE